MEAADIIIQGRYVGGLNQSASGERRRKLPILDTKSCSDLNQYMAIVNKLPAYNATISSTNLNTRMSFLVLN